MGVDTPAATDWPPKWRELQDLLGYHFSPDGGSAMVAAALHGSASQSIPHVEVLKPQRLRMAWVGDRIVGEVLAVMLYERLPEAAPGDLNRSLDELKSRAGLARVARETGLASYIVASENGREQAQQDNPLGEFFEALIGAVYDDGGPEAAWSVARRLLEARVEAHLDPEEQDRELEAFLAEVEGALAERRSSEVKS